MVAKVCSRCGVDVLPEQNFCPTCGESLAITAAPTPPVPSLTPLTREIKGPLTRIGEVINNKLDNASEALGNPAFKKKTDEWLPYDPDKSAFREALDNARGKQPVPVPRELSAYDVAYISMNKKNPGVAAVLSFFWCGLGQIYNGNILTGIALIIIQAINVLLMFVVIGFLTFPLFWLVGIVDAYQGAKNINKKLLAGNVDITRKISFTFGTFLQLGYHP